MQLPHLATSGRLSYLAAIDHHHQAEQGMESKTDRIRTALANGDWLTALRIASRFHDRSDETLLFKRGFDAYQHPGFYRQLGKDPDELVEAAITRLHARFAKRADILDVDVEVIWKNHPAS